MVSIINGGGYEKTKIRAGVKNASKEHDPVPV